MHKYSNQNVSCPHCGHIIKIPLDASAGSQEFYDDCSICYHPIHLTMEVDELHKTINLFVDADDEQIF
ncbi:CPXCG motif-containing cysteine-rich protein [Photobacterium carnosum]|uniref:CPXCG motif-containing cysteine-rich protein n=1 Tax=Photobacterium carnosum TaxID=2023717 RepID=UPI001E4AC1A3|nr:CPXCG motif-containing cysteine-rich protein [Photobacterium carnosum]MCD9528954.1 CPXCG motif-containing cysteine-rich protein [Photobacterium carnosum]MCF2152456.1 CPXCG motif-containing cysteine-rich protein [Photobacterium carnosum]MCF2216248.1 CPXCG motif-containing cysteine-rich protein [Photobacterium carnosum]